MSLLCLCVPAAASRGQQQPVGPGLGHQRTGRLTAAPQLQQGGHAHEAPAEVQNSRSMSRSNNLLVLLIVQMH